MILIYFIVATYIVGMIGFFFSLIAEKPKATVYYFTLLVVSLTMIFVIEYKKTPLPTISIEFDTDDVESPVSKKLM
jgi:hypothetical protein